jgi:hypothetical protein
MRDTRVTFYLPGLSLCMKYDVHNIDTQRHDMQAIQSPWIVAQRLVYPACDNA